MVPWFIPFLIGMAASPILGSVFSPMATPVTHLVNSITQFEIPTPDELIEMRWRKKISEAEYFIAMRKYGYTEAYAKQMYWSRERLLEADGLIRAKWRGFIDESTYKEKMHKLHFSEEEAELFEKVSKFFPSPGDLIRFAVREVYTPDIVKQYGMMEDLPEEFLREAAKAGLPEEQARNYWAAHWVLPSVEMGYEMLHRGVISMDELKTLMRTQDIMPYWRDKLIQISYRPFTRVDVRRMYSLGVLDREGVKRAYLDLGYDDEKAEKMTEFTIRYKGERHKEIAESKIRQAFLDYKIDAAKAKKMLRQLNYAEEEADFILSLWEDDRTEEELEETINDLSEQFMFGIISEGEFSDRLDELNLPTPTRDKIFRRTLRGMRKFYRLPSRTDLTRWLKNGIINLEQWRNWMRRIGYAPTVIDFYQAELGGG